VKLLLDQGLPRGACALLGDQGHDVLHVGDVGLAAAADEDILDWAVANDRVVVTLDADFHSILARRGAAGPSVVRIRVEGLRAEALATLLAKVLTQSEQALNAGAMVTAGPDGASIRERGLPLRQP
jgi:predicted nuclease of predicted toxin-antitoxin system